MSDVSQICSPITLSYDNDSQTVVIVPDDNDRFAMSVAEAVKACRVVDQLGIIRFQEQFKNLLNKLGSWSESHKDQISRSMVTLRDAGLLFLVCTNDPAQDQSFEDILTDLDLDVAQDPEFDLIRLSVLAIPSDSDEAVYCFADRNNNLVYAK